MTRGVPYPSRTEVARGSFARIWLLIRISIGAFVLFILLPQIVYARRRFEAWWNAP